MFSFKRPLPRPARVVLALAVLAGAAFGIGLLMADVEARERVGYMIAGATCVLLGLWPWFQASVSDLAKVEHRLAFVSVLFRLLAQQRSPGEIAMLIRSAQPYLTETHPVQVREVTLAIKEALASGNHQTVSLKEWAQQRTREE